MSGVGTLCANAHYRASLFLLWCWSLKSSVLLGVGCLNFYEIFLMTPFCAIYCHVGIEALAFHDLKRSIGFLEVFFTRSTIYSNAFLT